MAYYKIKNLTANLSKRHQQKNSTIVLEYRAGFDTEKHNLPVGGTLYISSPSLPVNLHKLRMKNLISVVEIGKNTFMKLQKPSVPVAPVEPPKKLVAKWNPELEQDIEGSKPKKTRNRKKKEESTLIVKEEE